MKTKNIELDKKSFLSHFGSLLSDALDETRSYGQIPGRLTFFKYAKTKSGITLAWFDHLLGSANSCPRRQLNKLSQKIVGTPLEEAIDLRVTPQQVFKKKFYPEYKIKSVKFSVMGPCRPEVTVTIENPALSLSTTAYSPVATTTKTTTTTTTTTATTTTTTAAFAASTTSSTTLPSTTSTTTSLFTTVTTIKNPSVPSFVFPSIPLPGHLPAAVVMNTEKGKLSVKSIKDLQIYKAFASKMSSLKLRKQSAKLPSWVHVNIEKWIIFALPSDSNLSEMEVVNSTHRVWKGELIFQNEDRESSLSIQIIIFVTLMPSSGDFMSRVTHKFKMKISNYGVKVC